MHNLNRRMVYYVTVVVALLGLCLPTVSSLECYSCFSYKSNVECESQFSLKIITCDKEYDTCLKYHMKVRIAEAINGTLHYVTNPGYARYCGRKQDCSSYPQTCPHIFRNDGEVKACNITCCDDDIIKSKCHHTPHYPGTMGSTNILTSNQTVGKGARGSGGGQLKVTIWFLFMTGALIWMFV